MHKCYHLSLESQLALHRVCRRWNLGFLLPDSAWERKPPQWVTQEMVTGQEGGSGRYWKGENYMGG